MLKKHFSLNQIYRLRDWYLTVGCNQEPKLISISEGQSSNYPLLVCREVQNKHLGENEKPDMYMCKGAINVIKSENILYRACPVDGCKKKVIEMPNQMFRCEKCNKEFPNFQYRLICNVRPISSHKIFN